MVTDGRFARATGQRCNGLHGWKRALARIVERSRPDCRKPLRRSFRFRTLKPRSALQCGARCDRATVSPARIHGQGPPSRVSNGTPSVLSQPLVPMKVVSSGPNVTVSGSGPKQRILVRVCRTRPRAACPRDHHRSSDWSGFSRCTTIHARDMQALVPHAGILASDRKLRNGNA